MIETDFQIPIHDWNIVGHEHAINTLRRALVVQRVRHAYLFTGPEHIGKTLLAQRFAQTLLCTGGGDAHMRRKIHAMPVFLVVRSCMAITRMYIILVDHPRSSSF